MQGCEAVGNLLHNKLCDRPLVKVVVAITDSNMVKSDVAGLPHKLQEIFRVNHLIHRSSGNQNVFDFQPSLPRLIGHYRRIHTILEEVFFHHSGELITDNFFLLQGHTRGGQSP